MHRNARESTHYIHILRPINQAVNKLQNCVMVGPGLDLGYSCGAEIFKNVEAMRAKELVAKEKVLVSKAR